MESGTFIIKNSDRDDLDFIFQLFNASIIYQERNGLPNWKNYDKNAIIRDVENMNHYKVIIENSIALVFSVCYDDPVIWRTKDTGDSIYLHRIVVNPNCKGQKLFKVVLDWSVDHAKLKNRHSIRMDTWANNTRLIQYYQRFGFLFIENFTTPDTPELPVHNRNLALALLEFDLK